MSKLATLQNMPSVDQDEEWLDWYARLSQEAKTQLAQAFQDAPKIAPSDGPQTDAYMSKADVLGYGGAAGGGKSALIAMLALNEHQRTVIFRADANQMKFMVDTMIEFAGTREGMNRNEKVFRLGDRPGHLIEWGGLSEPGSEEDWKGREHDLFCVDEATEVSEEKIRFLLTWNRTALPGQRTRVILTFNPPGGPEDVSGSRGRWVIAFFAPWIDERHPNPAKPGELRYFYTDDKGIEREADGPEPIQVRVGGKYHEVRPRSRTFIPALLHDNPYLAGTDYEQTVLSLKEPHRSRMLLGLFTSGICDNENQAIPTRWVDDAMNRWSSEGRREEMTAIGVDVARGGRCFTVIARRHGVWFDELRKIPGAETADGQSVVSQITLCVRDSPMINIDCLSVGASPYDLLRGNYKFVNGIQGSNKTRGKIPRMEKAEEFNNVRSALWWLLRKILDPIHGLDVALPPDDQLRSELVNAYYRRASGKWAMEPKEQMSDRVGYSPDNADAVIYSLYSFFDEDISDAMRYRPNRNASAQARRRAPAYGSSQASGGWMMQ